MTIIVSETLVKITCGCCGGLYAIAERYDEKCREDAKCWTCPYCKCSWGYPGKTEAQKQRERAERAEAHARIVQCNLASTERSLAATKGVVTRTKNRISKGVCPCCSRSFQNLRRHMTSKHPGYSEGEGLS